MKEDGGPAFPSSAVGEWFHGMTLRDCFAALAMMGMQARNAYDPGQVTPEQRSHLAYIEADAMLAERAK